MNEAKEIEKAFKTQNYFTSVVSVIDPVDPFKPAFSGRILGVKVDGDGFPSTVIIKLSDEFLVDDQDDGVREVKMTDVFQAHYVSLN